MAIPRYAVIAVLLLATGLSWWLVRSVEVSTSSPPQPRAVRHISDYSMDDFTLKAMDPQGRLHYRLHARHMAHYLDDDTAALRRPDIMLFRGEGGTWNAVSQRGWIGPDQKHVVLSGDVLVWRDTPKQDDALELETDKLHVTPDRQYAETDLPVTIAQPAGITHAVGMRVSVDQGRMELLNAVHGRYILKTH